MNLPILIKNLYGKFEFTGLYSFEFVDSHRKTISEIFLLMPPKTKNMQEGTRATINPTYGRNYITDGGNSIKTINLSGECVFPMAGSVENPLASLTSGEELKGFNISLGLTEFFKLRFLLVRYRDYTMTRNAQVSVPDSAASNVPGMPALIRKVESLVNKKVGALYDQLKLIFHDYDMDDHFYCRVSNFTSKQSDSKYIVMDYDIELECYEVDNRQTHHFQPLKASLEGELDMTNLFLQGR